MIKFTEVLIIMHSIIKKEIPQQEMHPVVWFVKDQSVLQQISGQLLDGTINRTSARIIKKPDFVVLEVCMNCY